MNPNLAKLFDEFDQRTADVERVCVRCQKPFAESEHGEATGFCGNCREEEGLVTHHSWSEDAQAGHYGAAKRLYHHAPARVRDSIQQHGLLTKYDEANETPSAVYFTSKPDPGLGDIWEVDRDALTGELNTLSGEPEEREDESWYAYYGDVPPQHLRLHHQGKTARPAKRPYHGHKDSPDEREKALDDWGVYGVHSIAEGEEFHPIDHMLDEAGPSDVELHRGLTVSPGGLHQLKTLSEINLKKSAWTSDPWFAFRQAYTTYGEDTGVVFHAPVGTPAVKNTMNLPEKEWITRGRFKVDRIEPDEHVHHVYLTPITTEKTSAVRYIPPNVSRENCCQGDDVRHESISEIPMSGHACVDCCACPDCGAYRADQYAEDPSAWNYMYGHSVGASSSSMMVDTKTLHSKVCHNDYCATQENLYYPGKSDTQYQDIVENGIKNPLYVHIDDEGGLSIQDGTHRLHWALRNEVQQVPVIIDHVSPKREASTNGKRAIVAIGIPGSGKSTLLKPYADALDAPYVGSDETRGLVTGDPADVSRDAEVWPVIYRRLHDALDKHDTVVFDATNADKDKRLDAVNWLRKKAGRVEGIYFDTPLDVALQRNDERDRHVPPDIVRGMHAKLQADPPGDEFDDVQVIGASPESVPPRTARHSARLDRKRGFMRQGKYVECRLCFGTGENGHRRCTKCAGSGSTGTVACAACGIDLRAYEVFEHAASVPVCADHVDEKAVGLMGGSGESGGFTLHLPSGEEVKGPGWIVSQQGHEEPLRFEDVSPERFKQYREKHADALRTGQWGGWNDSQRTGKVYLDVVKHYSSGDEARESALKNYQKAYFRLEGTNGPDDEGGDEAALVDSEDRPTMGLASRHASAEGRNHLVLLPDDPAEAAKVMAECLKAH